MCDILRHGKWKVGGDERLLVRFAHDYLRVCDAQTTRLQDAGYR
jgi:hypothetical protein